MFNRGKYSSVLSFVEKFAVDFSKEHNVLFEFSNKVSVGRGSTRCFDSNTKLDVNLVERVGNGKSLGSSFVVWNCSDKVTCPDYVVQIGIRDLCSRFSSFGLSVESSLALVMLSMTHEMRHVYQYDVAKNKVLDSSDLNFNSVHSLVISCDNSDFYHDNYNLMPHEIDAEKNGVLSAYKNLCVMYGKSRAKQLVTEALRYSDERGIGPVNYGGCKDGFTETWFEKCIDKAYDNALKSKRDASCLYDVFTDDFAANYFALNDADKKDFLNLSSGAEQDAYLAMISMMYSEKSRDYFDDSVIVFPEDIPKPLGGRLNRSIAVYNDVGGRDTSYIGNNFLDDNDIVFDDEYE